MGVVAPAPPLDKPILSDALFYDTLVKQIVREQKPFEGFDEIAVPEGFPPAVRSTLRDLLDAGIDEENVRAAVQEEFAGRSVDLGTLRSLLQLHRLYLQRIAKLNVLPRAELLRRAIELAPDTRYFQQIQPAEILYYGFYDLTGLQADFFQAVVKNHASRFFFPYVREHPAYVFAKRFRDTFVQPVMHEEIVLGDGPLPALSTKWRGGLRILNVSGLRDEAWFVANEIRKLHDEKGVAFSEIAVVARTKERLGFLIQEALSDRRVPYRASSHPSLMMFPVAQQAIQALKKLKPAEEESSWKRFAHECETHVQDERLLEGVRSLSGFDLIHDRVRWSEFVDTLRDRWSRTEVRDTGSSDAGVALLYAEAARGLPFKTVFLIGVEEKVFPRVVREDPFLRDDARLALNQTLGHKIGQKMTALEEERLLFELLTTSASEQLTLIHQRSDDDGGVVGASPFLRSFMNEHGLSVEADVESLPRPLFEKIKRVDPASLGVGDAVIGYLCAGREADALSLSTALGRDSAGLESGLRMQRALHGFGEPGAYDAVIGPIPPEAAFHKGKISATSLESYAQCGFKYFGTRLLGLAPLEIDELEQKLAADVRGKLMHRFVETFFRRATDDGKKALPGEFPTALFQSLFEEIVTPAAPPDTLLPPVLWTATRESLRTSLTVFLENEYASLTAEHVQPIRFEAEVEGRLPAPLDGFVWTGKIDRIDESATGITIVDYKSGRPFRLKSVSKLALAGEKLQAPIYMMLTRKFLESAAKSSPDVSFRYAFFDFVGEHRILESQEWDEQSNAILTSIRASIDSALAGDFTMKPGPYCDYCDIARACRRNHGISVYRAEKARGKK